MHHILFLGDSITDCNHCFTPDNLGDGFVKIIFSHLDHTKFQLVNGGTDGFTFPRIYRKWKQFYSDKRFDTVVILGGINDVSVAADTGLSESESLSFLTAAANSLFLLIQDLHSQNPKSNIILIEPFLFTQPSFLCSWMPSYRKLIQMIHEIMHTDYSISSFSKIHYLPTQKPFQSLAHAYGYAKLTTDGIHLTNYGHQILADLLLPLLIK